MKWLNFAVGLSCAASSAAFLFGNPPAYSRGEMVTLLGGFGALQMVQFLLANYSEID